MSRVMSKEKEGGAKFATRDSSFVQATHRLIGVFSS